MKKTIPFIFLYMLPVCMYAQTIKLIAPGIWKITYGTPGQLLPDELKEPPLTAGLLQMPADSLPAVNLSQVDFKILPSGTLAEINADDDERFYGLGMQTNTFEQRGMRREIRTNSWPVGNLGFGHASMPFYISSKGYGILVNTSRYTTFYMASTNKMDAQMLIKDTGTNDIKLNTEDLYGNSNSSSGKVNILVTGTTGIEIYVFNGPSMLNVMQRYNLFSGGGTIPPLWGLGFEYRAKATSGTDDIKKIGDYFRDNNIPCDMLGLEPGWQTNAYSCSFKWNNNNFKNPDSLIKDMSNKGFRLNLWEHAYTSPSSPIYKDIAPYSGNYKVWNGAVPDFSLQQAKNIFADYHETQFVKKGIAAFKLDECDAADYLYGQGEWSFPDITQFPGGMDGIQMRQLFGYLYQQTMLNIYKKNNLRTLFDVRASYLFASPFSSVIYSDMYKHEDYIRMIANSAFAGVNWSPELRETNNDAELVRRMQTTVMSAHMVANCWYLDLPPWLQYVKDKNVKHELLPNAKELEQKAKKLIDLRMSLLPYLYAAFAKYHFEGTPPFRPLVMDFPNDKNTWKIDDEYMMGESILCAPFTDGSSTRKIYLPSGNWYDFNSSKKYSGDSVYQVTMTLDEIPMFIKDNSIIPLAKPLEYIAGSSVFDIVCNVYGHPAAAINLFEDNNLTYDFDKNNFNWVALSWNGKKINISREGNYKKILYRVAGWNMMGQ